MSKALRSLGNQGRELSKLLKDVQRLEADPSSLDADVSAFHTLGKGIRATKWVLAEHFLSSYVEWAQMYGRYYRYFGQSEQLTPRRWQSLRAQCDHVRRRFLTNPRFEQLPARLIDEWGNQKGTTERDSPNYNASVEDSYLQIVRTDLQLRTSMIFAWVDGDSEDQLTQSLSSQHTILRWSQLAHHVHARQQQLLADIRNSDTVTQTELRELIQNYRHATLRVSWLEEKGRGPTGLLMSFGHDSGNRQRMIALADFLDAVMQQNSPPDLYKIVDRVLGRIGDAVHEIGYENFVNDVTSSDFLGGDGSPLGSPAINVIPGTGATKCCSVLVALSRGSSKTGKLGLPKVLQQVKIHLTQCAAITRVVIVLCDTWDFRSFANDHYHELRAHHRNGIRFLFLMIGAPDTAIAAVDVRF